jgi:hypothetical protein
MYVCVYVYVYVCVCVCVYAYCLLVHTHIYGVYVRLLSVIIVGVPFSSCHVC